MAAARSGRHPRRQARRAVVAAAAPLVAGALAALAAAGRAAAVGGGGARTGARAALSGSGAPAGAGADDLLVYGAGYLGRLVAGQWLAQRPGARVVGATRSEASHEELRALGLEPRTVGPDLAAAAPPGGFPHVVFAAPPGARPAGGDAGASSYADAVGEALSLWSRSETSGGFVFTSSGGVFAEDAGGTVDESSAVSDAPRAAALLDAERRALRGEGTVLRLAGLYDVARGPHAYWLKAGAIKGSPEGLINLVHYEDAAGAVLAALGRGPAVRGATLLVGDGAPMTRAEIVEAARGSTAFAGAAAPVFEVPEGAPRRTGKVYDVRKARELLRWTPRYGSFAHFMALQR